jgi:methionine sulfoxide reductase heme-binding subunit
VKTDPTFWILTRASGFTAYALLTASVLAGLLLKARPFGARVKPATALDLHRFLTLLGFGFISLHGLGLVLDRSVDTPVLALLVPGIGEYRPLWTGLGVVTAELMVLLTVSFPLRRFIGTKSWRRLHWAAYLTFGLATVHGIAAGSDSPRSWALGAYLAAVGAVAAATAWRALVPPSPTRTRRAEGQARSEATDDRRVQPHRPLPAELGALSATPCGAATESVP